MKLKKILALSVCAVMTMASVANAAYIVDEGWYVADEVTFDQVANYTQKAAIDVSSLTAEEAKAAGLPLGRGASALTDANSDFYQIDVTFTDLGDLMYAYLAGSDFGKEMQVKVVNAKVELKDLAFKKVATTSSFNGVAWAASEPGNSLNSLSMYWFAGSDSAAYPGRTPASGDLEGTYIESADTKIDKASFVIAVDEGYTKTISPNSSVTYYVLNGSGDKSMDVTNGIFPNGDVVFGAPAEEKHAEITADLEGKYDRGYVWTTEITKGDKDIESFKAKFETADDSTERSIKNVDALNKFLGEGKTAFQVGLFTPTKKELTKATFTVNDGDDHSAEWLAK